jgi:hypothetical protein
MNQDLEKISIELLFRKQVEKTLSLQNDYYWRESLWEW